MSIAPEVQSRADASALAGLDVPLARAPVLPRQPAQDVSGEMTADMLQQALAELELYLSLTEGLPGAVRDADRHAAKLAAEYLRGLLKLN